jgi:hypothetical protein
MSGEETSGKGNDSRRSLPDYETLLSMYEAMREAGLPISGELAEAMKRAVRRAPRIPTDPDTGQPLD